MRTLFATVTLALGACSFAPTTPDVRIPLPPQSQSPDAGQSATIPAQPSTGTAQLATSPKPP